MPTKKVTTKIKIGGKVKITPGTAKEDWSNFPQPPVTKKVECDRKLCASRTFRGKNVCDGELVFEGVGITKCPCVCHAEKVIKKLKKLLTATDEHKEGELYDNFQDNPFAKKYKEELKPQWDRLEKSGFYNEIMEDMIEQADQVKSWSKHERAGVYDQIARSIIMFTLGVIIGVVAISL